MALWDLRRKNSAIFRISLRGKLKCCLATSANAVGITADFFDWPKSAAVFSPPQRSEASLVAKEGITEAPQGPGVCDLVVARVQ